MHASPATRVRSAWPMRIAARAPSVVSCESCQPPTTALHVVCRLRVGDDVYISH